MFVTICNVNAIEWHTQFFAKIDHRIGSMRSIGLPLDLAQITWVQESDRSVSGATDGEE